jgi:hypothetical protein
LLTEISDSKILTLLLTEISGSIYVSPASSMQCKYFPGIFAVTLF